MAFERRLSRLAPLALAAVVMVAVIGPPSATPAYADSVVDEIVENGTEIVGDVMNDPPTDVGDAIHLVRNLKVVKKLGLDDVLDSASTLEKLLK